MRVIMRLRSFLFILITSTTAACTQLLGDVPAGKELADDGGADATTDSTTPVDSGMTPGDVGGGDGNSGPDAMVESGGTEAGVDAGTDAGADAGCAPQSCPLGCAGTGANSHCAVMQPAAPVTAADLTASGVSDLVISTSVVAHTDTGAIDGIRAANTDPATYQVVSGIGFQLFSGSHVGVFTVGTLKVNASTTMQVVGAPGFALAAATTIVLEGTLDGRGYDAMGVTCDGESTNANTSYGPGALPGGNGTSAMGAGGGQSGDIGGGGGGGFGAAGGNGGMSPADTFAGASQGGPASSMPPLPIAGGFGGGAGGGGAGGGGGGAIQLVAGTSITIGGGATAGGINVGGCGGVGGANPSAGLMNQGGGGGGSGGMILLQSPVITMTSTGALAANGGAGGSGGGRGSAGLLSAMQAQPQSLSGSDMGAGGAGGAGTMGLGGAGTMCGSSCLGGGGGGGYGFILLQNATGSVAASGVVSPPIGSAATFVTTVASQ